MWAMAVGDVAAAGMCVARLTWVTYGVLTFSFRVSADFLQNFRQKFSLSSELNQMRRGSCKRVFMCETGGNGSVGGSRVPLVAQ